MNIDPTSYLRLKQVMSDKEFRVVFIVMDDKTESLYTLKNIRMIDSKILVVFVNNGEEEILLEDENVTILDTNEIVAGNLYEKLPNVPLIAKNIGLGRGEIMEVLVPVGSSFAFRHVGAISHRKWRVVAIYRNEKQILPNPATMILPNDRLIVMGNPIVLEGVYKKINERQGVFPEPFGRNIYLILDSEAKKEDILLQVNEAVFLSNQLSKTKLYIRLICINNFELIQELRIFENEHVSLLLSYNDEKILQDIDYDISQLDIGLFLLNNRLFFKKNYKEYLYDLTRPIYLFGEKSLYNIKEAVILMGDEGEMESLSSSVFDFSENLGLSLSLCDYNPEGDFEDNRNIIEHYESLSRLYNFRITIEQKRVNPIRELLKHENILHIAPFSKNIRDTSFISYLSTEMSHYFLSIKKHPQLLIPVDN
ncbi:TrkA domain protein [hydrothermal vent metagenome]|uniref:TrkA domain protein n=1 Tax=hydrothermal vent metagenome TaxID=652676 RepID=A0A1W1BWS4_9ZZZZ